MLSGYIQWLKFQRPSMTAQVLIVFDIWRFMIFFNFFFQKVRYEKKLAQLDFLNSKVGCYQGTINSWKSSVEVWRLKSFWFSRYGVFYDFSFFFFKKLRYKKLTPNELLIPIVWYGQGINSGLANLTSNCDCWNPFGIQDMVLSYDVFIFFFFKKHRNKKN